MNIIFIFFQNVFGIQNIGLSIVFFTIVVYTLMLPMNYKQQKFSHMNKIMGPEVKKIQDKYKGKTDQESMMKQNDELREVYSKYGVAPAGSCLQMIISLPIMFALYRIIYNIPAYVESVRGIYSNLVDEILKVIEKAPEYVDTLKEFAARTVNVSGNMDGNLITQILYNFKSGDWGALAEKFPSIDPNIIETTKNAAVSANRFLLLDIAESPSSTLGNCLQNGLGEIFSNLNWLVILIALLIPLLAGLFQWLSVKAIPQADMSAAGDTTANTMKTMNNVMPLISIVFCFTIPLGVGIYWTASSLYRFVSNVIMNKKLDKMDMNKVVEKNLAKINAKREKKGLPPQKVAAAARMNTKNVEADKPKETDTSAIREKVRKSTEYYNQKSSNPNSISAKANMVRQYDERNAKKKK